MEVKAKAVRWHRRGSRERRRGRGRRERLPHLAICVDRRQVRDVVVQHRSVAKLLAHGF